MQGNSDSDEGEKNDDTRSPLSSEYRIEGAVRRLAAMWDENPDAELTRIGKYQIRRLLSCRGQATVLVAFDPELKRQVVIKLYGDPPAGQQKRRMIHEGRALARLSNPHIAACYGVEEHNGRPFLVLEYVPGEALSDVLRRKQLPLSDCLEIISSLTKGLEAAHRVGLLHRDIKPSNVIVSSGGLVKLIDFGLVQSLAEADAADPSGTPAYMAPEVARNDASAIDQRTDVFGLGAILYAMLTGVPPFDAETGEESRRLACLGNVAEAKTLRLGIPSRVNELCMRCLQSNISQRFHGVGEFRDAIDQFRSRRARLARTSVVVGLAFTIFVIGLLFARKSAPANLSWPNVAAMGAYQRDFQIAVDLLAKPGNELTPLRAEQGVFQLIEGRTVKLVVRPEEPCWLAVCSIEHDADADSYVVEPLFPAAGEANYIEARQQHVLSITPTASTGTDYLLVVGCSEKRSGQQLFEMARAGHLASEVDSAHQRTRGMQRNEDDRLRLTKYVVEYRVAGDSAARASNHESADSQPLERILAEVRDAENRGEFASALARRKEAYELQKSLNSPDDVGWQKNAVQHLAGLAECAPDFSEAIRYIDELIKIRKDSSFVWDETRAELIRSVRNLSDNAKRETFVECHRARWPVIRCSLDQYWEGSKNTSQWREVLPAAESALKIAQRDFPENHLLTLRSAEIVGLVRRWAGLPADVPFFQQQYEAYTALVGAKHAMTINALGNLAHAYWSAEDFVNAEARFREANTLAAETRGAASRFACEFATQRGRVLMRMNRVTEARALFEDCLDLARERESTPGPEYAGILIDLASCSVVLREFRESLPYSELAVDILRPLAETSPIYARELMFALKTQAQGAAFGNLPDQAIPLIEDVLEYSESILGKDASHANMLRQMARFTHTFDSEKAIQLCTEGFELYERVTAGDGQLKRLFLRDLGTLNRDHGNYKKAAEWYGREIKLGQSDSNRTVVQQASSLGALGLNHLLAGEKELAQECYRQSLRLFNQFLEVGWPLFPLDDAQNWAAKRDRSLFGLLQSIDIGDQAQVMRGLEHVWHSKGAISRSLAIRARMFRRLESEQQVSQRQELNGIAKQLSRVTLASMAKSWTDDRELEDNPSPFARIVNTKQDILNSIMPSIPAHLRQETRDRDNVKSLSDKLPPGTAIVEYLQTEDVTRPAQLPGQPIFRSEYHAFVISADGDGELSVAYIPIGPARRIDSKVDSWCEQLVVDSDAAARGLRRDPNDIKLVGTGEELREYVWEPIEPYLGECRTVIICPDGGLTRLPWSALPGRSKKFLVEELELAQASNTRKILATLSAKALSDGNLVALGNVAFGGNVAPPKQIDLIARSRGLSPLPASWHDLPGTQREIDAIEKIWGDQPKVILSRKDANEAKLVSALPEARYLHLSSHGFCISPKDLEDESESRLPHYKIAEVVRRNPLVASAIVLAGVNQPSPDPSADDQFLTGEETINQDLSHVELVTLSACDSGLGKILMHEGAFGIKKAMLIGGARSTLTSLWRVDDDATVELMREFYGNLWSNKLGKAESLRQAQLRLIESNAPIGTWAPWVIEGDWR